MKKQIIDLLNQEVNRYGLVLREADAIKEAQISLMSAKEKELFAAELYALPAATSFNQSLFSQS